MWGPSEWFRYLAPDPAHVCKVAEAFAGTKDYAPMYTEFEPWDCNDIPHHLFVYGWTVPVSMHYVLLCTDGPFLRLNTSNVVIINRVLATLGYPPIAKYQPVIKC